MNESVSVRELAQKARAASAPLTLLRFLHAIRRFWQLQKKFPVMFRSFCR